MPRRAHPYDIVASLESTFGLEDGFSMKVLIPFLVKRADPIFLEEVKLGILTKLIPFLLEEADSLLPSLGGS